ncbi:MAG: vitamin K epoxide reductase family protein [Calditrichia bacterium]
MKKASQIKHLPFPVYFFTIVLLAFLGLGDSIYLSISHYRNYTDVGYISFCAISKSINCDTVSQSPYSIFLSIPVAVWGVIGYAFFLIFLSFAGSKQADRKRVWPLLFLISIAFSIASIILAVISSFYIQSYCIMCVLIFGINFMLLFYVWIIRKRFDNSGLFDALRQDLAFLWLNKIKSVSLLSAFIFMVVLIVVFYPKYWQFPLTFHADISKGVTDEGHPWIGDENPEYVITEFTDYQCFQCKKMHYFLRMIAAKHVGKIKIVHRHFPMDNQFNPLVTKPYYVGSGKLALLAIYASTKGKFWEVNDILFKITGKKDTVSVREIAEKAGLDPAELASSINSKAIRSMLWRDIHDGIKLGLTGTPSFVINDKVYQGQLPAEIVKKLIK